MATSFVPAGQMQELEQRVMEADQRAERAEKQVESWQKTSSTSVTFTYTFHIHSWDSLEKLAVIVAGCAVFTYPLVSCKFPKTLVLGHPLLSRERAKRKGRVKRDRKSVA